MAVDGELSAVTTVAGGAVTAVIGGAALWLANRVMGRAAFQQAINDGFAKLLTDLQEDNESLRELLAQERRLSRGERQQLRGEVAQLHQWAESLERLLRSAGIEVPERRPGPMRPAVLMEKSDVLCDEHDDHE